METVTDFIFLGSKITADGDRSHEIKRRLLLGRKAMTNLRLVAQSCPILCNPMGPPGPSVHRDSPGKNTGVGCHAILQDDKPRQHIKKQRHYFATEVHLVKAMVFPAVMYGCESWVTKKAECQGIDGFELWCWRRLLRVPWTARRSNQSILEEISPEYSLEGLMLKLKLQYFGHLM